MAPNVTRTAVVMVSATTVNVCACWIGLERRVNSPLCALQIAVGMVYVNTNNVFATQDLMGQVVPFIQVVCPVVVFQIATPEVLASTVSVFVKWGTKGMHVKQV